MAVPGILKLPNELLLRIFELGTPPSDEEPRGTIPSLRLTCRLFNELTSHLLLEWMEVDISRPVTLSRFQIFAANPKIAKGVRALYIRLHFYHPWVAATFENFEELIKSEWEERSIFSDKFDGTYLDVLSVTDIAMHFLNKLHGLESEDEIQRRQNEWYRDPIGECPPNLLRIRPWQILSQAYDSYKCAFQTQDRILSNGNLFRLSPNLFLSL